MNFQFLLYHNTCMLQNMFLKYDFFQKVDASFWVQHQNFIYYRLKVGLYGELTCFLKKYKLHITKPLFDVGEYMVYYICSILGN